MRSWNEFGRIVFILGILPLLVYSIDDAQNETCLDSGFKTLDCLGARVHNSWVEQLAPDPEQERHVPNQKAREVTSGHYVFVRPTPLPNPYLIAYSSDMAEQLGLDESVCKTERFVSLFSGDVGALSSFRSSWATPYALSIYGSEQFPNGAGPHSNGYGDGRAISLAEVVAQGMRWELQLKGSGPTPFCRGSDGRAVLRSSVREFLASEAMHNLGVPTTRALSLVATDSEHVQRPWYSKASQGNQNYGKHGGDIMQEERCAITTRVAPSFLRVGHFELFGRRARRGDVLGKEQLELLAKHALFREYPHLINVAIPFQDQVVSMVAEAAERFTNLSAEWLRVGYTQSNFNADNCLISGLTVDYGPFGFIERYDPGWGMWIHAGEHFSFMNQPHAARENFKMFATSLEPLLDGDRLSKLRDIIKKYDGLSRMALKRMWARKLGFTEPRNEVWTLWETMEDLMKRHPTDYTIIWRQLAELPVINMSIRGDSANGGDTESLLAPLEIAFYETLPEDLRSAWVSWIHRWMDLVISEGRSPIEVSDAMKQASPKYVPRESMLVDAYTAAQRGDHSVIHSLAHLFRRPYDEQPFFGERYYSRQAKGAHNHGGIGYMS